jgi:hypothetical protein
MLLGLGAESNSLTSHAEYNGHEVITMSWICPWARRLLPSAISDS